VVAATERRRIDGVPSRNGQTSQPPLHHHHSMHGTVGSQVPPTPHSIAPHPGASRPSLDRAHTFPTPPTSASSVLAMGNQGGSYEWGAATMGNSVAGTQPLSIDTGLSNARSMPTTPATTPPGSSISNMQSYQGQQGYDNSKSFYSAPPTSQSAYASHQTPTQQNMARYGGAMTANTYKNEMGPPSAPGGVNGSEAEHPDIKSEQYQHTHVSSGPTDAEADHQHDNSYMGANTSAFGSNRTQYAYTASSGVGTVQGDHAHMSPVMSGSPHQSGSGRATPRGTNGTHQWQPQGYQTPPRAAPSSNLYNVMSDSRGANGTPTTDHYASNYTSTSLNGAATSNKRAREDDNDSGRPDSRGLESAFDLKRRKTIRQDAMGVPMGQMSSLQGIKTGGGLPRQR
jgi:enhanced filamentous growth protein 1